MPPLAHIEMPVVSTLEERMWRGGYPALHASHPRDDHQVLSWRHLGAAPA